MNDAPWGVNEARPQARSEVEITGRDRMLLSFVAEHRLVLAPHAQALMRTSAAAAYQRLAALSTATLLSRRTVFHGEPGCYQITASGLAAIESELPRPRLDLRCYRHDVGVAWMWLAARGGAFGEVEQIVGERRMRSFDGTCGTRGAVDAEPFGVRLGGLGPRGSIRLHYPDLLLVTSTGRRIALELELSSKSRARREGIVAGYGADPRVGAVLYLCESSAVANAIRSAAARLGVAPLVHVQRLVSSRPKATADAGRIAIASASKQPELVR